MRILLISEQQLQQGLLRIALERNKEMEIVGEYLEGKAALRALSEKRGEDAPELVIQGLYLPDMDGIALTEQLRKQLPQARILAVTGQPAACRMVSFLLAGGSGYLSQYSSDEEFFRAIEEVMSGRIYLDRAGNDVLEATYRRLSELRELVIHREVVRDDVTPAAFLRRQLSEREKQVLHLFVNGYSSSEIGGILYMSVNTVETHKKRIKEKLNLTRKADLTGYAKENGLFEDWD